MNYSFEYNLLFLLLYFSLVAVAIILLSIWALTLAIFENSGLLAQSSRRKYVSAFAIVLVRVSSWRRWQRCDLNFTLVERMHCGWLNLGLLGHRVVFHFGGVRLYWEIHKLNQKQQKNTHKKRIYLQPVLSWPRDSRPKTAWVYLHSTPFRFRFLRWVL